MLIKKHLLLKEELQETEKRRCQLFCVPAFHAENSYNLLVLLMIIQQIIMYGLKRFVFKPNDSWHVYYYGIISKIIFSRFFRSSTYEAVT